MTNSNHAHLQVFAKLIKARGEIWKARGYSLAQDKGQSVIDGDFGQFYLDAVSRDAEAHLALEFLRLSDSPDWPFLCGLASDDDINLSESQDVFMMGKSLQEHLDTLE
jgi:hypothetical protein